MNLIVLLYVLMIAVSNYFSLTALRLVFVDWLLI